MLRTTLFYIVLMAASLLYFVPLHGQEEERGLAPFEAVSVTGGIEVILEKGDSEKAKIRTWGIDVEKVDLFVKGRTLKIQLLNLSKIDDRQVKVYLTYKELHGVRATAGARVYGRDLIESDRFVVRVGSGGFADLEVETNSLDARAGEGGVIEISGKADTVDVSASTGGRYEGYDLEANRTHARASTGGEITVVAHEALDASANTGGSINYRGQPKEKNTRTLFSGGIHKM
ncbi:head GIN domain-containing protein [Flavilitoribacter nigricans]|uniref:Putative auto-transporter adhesin head GIN domain-containing protein n=1 Tax=Flavilitoribacter nigricans (strain ATCC 23147 / DSM 23189 / NBRC 102662 / NCIMB 1420 / SS-2) TaxID=1122177 RepID=A0A2D0N4N6_FLAN2|nr:head GIN domain-containing protein [Flavilitoribacter nigricans]PHN03119.1 hypothetical protein CRP01_28995 [Flavilitoribacter nigricans DSM 23189 = NBRC 102662]